jgi:hypothetical protein
MLAIIKPLEIPQAPAILDRNAQGRDPRHSANARYRFGLSDGEPPEILLLVHHRMGKRL